MPRRTFLGASKPARDKGRARCNLPSNGATKARGDQLQRVQAQVNEGYCGVGAGMVSSDGGQCEVAPGCVSYAEGLKFQDRRAWSGERGAVVYCSDGETPRTLSMRRGYGS